MTKQKKKNMKVHEKEPFPLILPHTPLQIWSLPHDLVLSCLARIPKLNFPKFSGVSKSFRALLTSPELYQTRSLLNLTESCLYVCLQPAYNHMPVWFTLVQKSSGYVLAKVKIPPKHCFRLVMVGSNIYNVGSSIHPQYLTSVSVLDCCSDQWHRAPNMLVKRRNPTANVVDGKIYVTGGCTRGLKELNSSNWMEVFDPKTQTWELVLCPFADICKNHIYKSAVIEGKIYYMFEHEFVAYKPREDKWEIIRENSDLDIGWSCLSYCVINNILFCYSFRDRIKWYDSKIGCWRHLIGLRRLPVFMENSLVKLADYGGKLAVFWDEYLPSMGYQSNMIWCAMITLEIRNDLEMWGIVQWLGAVLNYPELYEFVAALYSTV